MPKKSPKFVHRYLPVSEQHRLEIARRTLALSDVGAKIMGGMTKAEARQVILKLTGRKPREDFGQLMLRSLMPRINRTAIRMKKVGLVKGKIVKEHPMYKGVR